MKVKYVYKPNGVCSREISFDVNDDVVTNINFVGGCPGNLKMISKLLDGYKIEEIIKKCEGNTCGMKSTSCSDQLAKGLKEALLKEKSHC